MKKNDKKIMELKEQIQIKNEELNKIPRFRPITSCIIPSFNETNTSINIHTLSKSKIIDLMIDINIRILSAKDLGIEEVYDIAGFKATDWLLDMKAKLKDIERKEKEINLKNAENKLTTLLSEEKQTELEIEKIANIL